MGSGASRGPKPTLYIFPMSAPCRAVLMTAKAAGIPYETKIVDVTKGEQNSKNFTEINPDHTVPALVDASKQLNLWESRAIMTYLIDTYAPGHPIYPKDPAVRAHIDRLLFRDISFVAQNVNAFLFPQIWRHEPADAQKQAEVEKVFDYLEDLLKDDRLFLTGNRLTIADFSVSASISMLELNDWQFSRWVKVDEWRKRVQELAYYEEVNKPLDEFKQKIRAQQQDE